MSPIEKVASLSSVLQRLTKLEFGQERLDSARLLPGAFEVFIRTRGRESSHAASNPWNEQDAERIAGSRSLPVDREDLLKCLKDLEAAWAIGSDVFITANQLALSFRDVIQDRVRTLMMSLPEAAEYIDIYLKRKNVFAYGPRHTITGTEGYYWGRQREIMEPFTPNWRTAVCSEQTMPDGSEVLEHLRSFSVRVLSMIETKDRIADQYYQRANNSVEWRIMRELNSFFPLVTGSLDSLAWLLRYVFRFRAQDPPTLRPLRQAVSLRSDAGRDLISHVRILRPTMATLLDSSQQLFNIFYPSRDSIQHRHPLSAVHFVRARGRFGAPLGEGDLAKAFILAVVDDDTLDAMQRSDREDPSDYFSEWGLLRYGDKHFLEPYKFVRKAVSELSEFYTAFFRLLDLYEVARHVTPTIDEHLKTAEESADKHRGEFCFPLLAPRDLPPLHPSIPRIIPDTGRGQAHASNANSMAAFGGGNVLVVELVS